MRSVTRPLIRCLESHRGAPRPIKRQANDHAATARSVPMPEESCIDSKSLVEIVRPHFENQTPVVLRGAVANARAIQQWKSWDYFETTVDGDTSCHVEVGGNYTQSQRCDIRFGDYLMYLKFFEERHGRSASDSITTPSDEELVYLAQNDAFEELYQDFGIPDLTSLGEGKIYNCMVWMGPYGCVSPLHFDPMDNALMQFVGVKQVLMYPPESYVYAGTDGNQSNTSPLNPEETLNLKKHPLAADLPPPLKCRLTPGDVLFIPKKWWHFVRTVQTSVNINCWWR